MRVDMVALPLLDHQKTGSKSSTDCAYSKETSARRRSLSEIFKGRDRSTTDDRPGGGRAASGIGTRPPGSAGR